MLAATTPHGAAYTLFCVGGFAMGRSSESRLTQDIDVATPIPVAVCAAAAQVAARHNMNPAWLNDQVSEMIQAPLPADRFVEAYRGRCLIVCGADDELMLALKLMSGRGRDVGDIVELARRTGRATPDELLDAWDHIYGSVPAAAPHRDFVDGVIEDVMGELRRRSAMPRHVGAAAASGDRSGRRSDSG